MSLFDHITFVVIVWHCIEYIRQNVCLTASARAREMENQMIFIEKISFKITILYSKFPKPIH